MTEKFRPRNALDKATGEPLEPYNERGVALHGFGLGVKRHIPTGEEMKEIERRILESHGMDNKSQSGNCTS